MGEANDSTIQRSCKSGLSIIKLPSCMSSTVLNTLDILLLVLVMSRHYFANYEGNGIKNHLRGGS